MSSRSTAALARSYGVERALVFIIGLLVLAAGAIALVVAQGWIGSFRAGRPLLDPLAIDFLRQYLLIARIVAIVVGILLLIYGLSVFVRAFRPERKPNLRLNDESEERITVTSSAVAGALEGDCELIEGVNKARARAVGTADAPAIRLSLWLDDGTDIRTVWNKLDNDVLHKARQSLGVERLPTAVRLEMDAAAVSRVE